MRVVSICPSNTEIMGYLGKTNWLVGVDNFSDWPETVLDLPKLGPDLSIDMDKVASCQPDLVLASLSVPGMEKNIAALDERKLPYIILNPNSLEEIAEDIQKVGNALGCSELGREKANVFRKEINVFRNHALTQVKKPTLYWEWWPKPIFTPGGVNWLTEISELAGAKNIFADKNVASVQTDWEDVKQRNPDHICMVWVGVKEEKMNPELIKKRPGWKMMRAIQNDQIHILPESLFCRPSPRLLEGLCVLVKTITD